MSDCEVCPCKTGGHYMRQNGTFGCRICGGAYLHYPAGQPEPEMHAHTYNIAGVCTGCGRDASLLAADHEFCEESDTAERNGGTMVLDMILKIVSSDRSDADKGVMLLRVLNAPTLANLRSRMVAVRKE